MAGKLEHQARELIGKNWSKASGTRQVLLGNVARIADFMRQEGLNRIQDMKAKHVNSFFARQKNLSASARANYATAMRTIAGAIGKQNIVPRDNASLGITRSDRMQPKELNHEAFQKAYEKLSDKEPWHRLAVDMQQAFGLRILESLGTHKTVEHDGKLYLQVEWAKGGREREIEVCSGNQVAALAAVQSHIASNGLKSLLPASMSKLEGYHAHMNMLHRVGMTRENGCNSHVLRHEFARAELARGVDRQTLAEMLGHGRLEVTYHYSK